MDTPDEKKQPTIEVRDENRKVTHKSHMPVTRSPDGRGQRIGLRRAGAERRFRATTTTSPAVCRRASSSCSRRPRAACNSGRLPRSTGSCGTAASSRGSARSSCVREDGGEPEILVPRRARERAGRQSRPGGPADGQNSDPHDILSVLRRGVHTVSRRLQIQEVYQLQGVNINDKHVEVIVRQMMRSVKIKDQADRIPDGGAGEPEVPLHGRRTSE